MNTPSGAENSPRSSVDLNDFVQQEFLDDSGCASHAEAGSTDSTVRMESPFLAKDQSVASFLLTDDIQAEERNHTGCDITTEVRSTELDAPTDPNSTCSDVQNEPSYQTDDASSSFSLHYEDTALDDSAFFSANSTMEGESVDAVVHVQPAHAAEGVFDPSSPSFENAQPSGFESVEVSFGGYNLLAGAPPAEAFTSGDVQPAGPEFKVQDHAVASHDGSVVRVESSAAVNVFEHGVRTESPTRTSDNDDTQPEIGILAPFEIGHMDSAVQTDAPLALGVQPDVSDPEMPGQASIHYESLGVQVQPSTAEIGVQVEPPAKTLHDDLQPEDSPARAEVQFGDYGVQTDPVPGTDSSDTVHHDIIRTAIRFAGSGVRAGSSLEVEISPSSADRLKTSVDTFSDGDPTPKPKLLSLPEEESSDILSVLPFHDILPEDLDSIIGVSSPSTVCFSDSGVQTEPPPCMWSWWLLRWAISVVATLLLLDLTGGRLLAAAGCQRCCDFGTGWKMYPAGPRVEAFGEHGRWVQYDILERWRRSWYGYWEKRRIMHSSLD